jgi:HEPN domain-containing protein
MNPLALEWVKKAEGGYVTARRERLARLTPNYDAACFHAQQMAEKYLKAYLQAHELEIPRSHDLIELLNLCQPNDPAFALLEPDFKELNGYAVGIRYPGQQADKEDAVQAVRLARVIREFVRQRLKLDTIG